LKRIVADVDDMATMLLSFISVSCFCVFAHAFIKSLLKPLPRVNNTGYSKTALRLKKHYQTFSLGVMTFAFMIGLVISFYQVYVEL
jgi:hypothetical protein